LYLFILYFFIFVCGGSDVKRFERREKRRLAERARVKAEAEKQAAEAAFASAKQQVQRLDATAQRRC
jgi:hypothetical protein